MSSAEYGCCKTSKLDAQDYLLGTCCIPCAYGYGGYKSIKSRSPELGFCTGALVCLSASMGATICTPLMGCYVRVTQVNQPFMNAAGMECCAPFTCAPCQMAYYGRTQTNLSVNAKELL